MRPYSKLKSNIWDYFLVLIFVLTSGCVKYLGTISIAGAFFLFLLLGIFRLCLKSERTRLIENSSYSFIIWVAILCFLNLVFLQSGYKTNAMIGYLVVLIGAFVFIAQYDFYRFRDLLTDVVFIITLIGLIVYALFSAGLISPCSFYYGDTEYVLVGPYTLGWPYIFGRYSGIWHEPGAGQIIVNTVLWLNIDKIIERKWNRTDLCKYIVLTIGVFMSKSTGGYIVFMLFCLATFPNMHIKGKYKFLFYIILLGVAILIVYSMFNSEVIQNKLFEADGESVSKLSRMYDIVALWEIAIDYPLYGAGIGTDLFWNLSEKYGNTANSSGFMTYMASCGIPWAILFIVTCKRNIDRLKLGKVGFYMLVAVILMEFNECFIEYPITSIFVFKFKSYLKNYA